MGVIPSAKNPAVTPTAAKRRSGQLDLSNLGPLKTTGTVGFSAFRDKDSESAKRKKKSRTKSNGSLGAMDEDSDEDDEDEPEILGKMEDLDDKEVKLTNAPEEANELTEGVDRIRVRPYLSFRTLPLPLPPSLSFSLSHSQTFYLFSIYLYST